MKRVTPDAIWDAPESWKRSVYVVADRDGVPLYIGKATGEKWPGIGNRYWGQTGALSALGHGSRNRVHVGRILGKPRLQWYADLELELIARERKATKSASPVYNREKGRRRPTAVQLRHKGRVPRFAHLN